MKIRRKKLDFEGRETAEELFESVVFDEDKLRQLIYDYVDMRLKEME